MKFEEIKVKLLLTLSVVLMVALFFLITLTVYDNRGAKFMCVPYNDSESEVMITAYTGEPTNLEIPEKIDGKKVVAIGSNAFAGNVNLKKVSIPGGVKSIGEYAFSGCTSLKSCELEEGVEEIGYKAFYGCRYLKEVEIPGTLKKIDDEAFRDCERLSKLKIPKSCTDIGTDVFRACMSLTVIAPDNPIATEYAEKYGIPTSFKESDDFLYVKLALAVLAVVVVFFTVVFIFKKIFGKKDVVEIRFVDSEMSRLEKTRNENEEKQGFWAKLRKKR
jgi:hypothetical protein